MSRTLPRRAVIYCRISNDPEGRELGVKRQEVDCRALADRLGLTVIRVYVENDVSASTLSSKPRPQYAAMLAAIDAGEADVILAYSNSRLTPAARWNGLASSSAPTLAASTSRPWCPAATTSRQPTVARSP